MTDLLPGQLSLADYERAVRGLPILCVDVILYTPSGLPVLLKRRNEPLAGEWWVPGGRVYKGEPVDVAAVRKLKEECGVAAERGALEFVGYYEEVFNKSRFGLGKYHAVSLVFASRVPVRPTDLTLDDQHSEAREFAALPAAFVERLRTGRVR